MMPHAMLFICLYANFLTTTIITSECEQITCKLKKFRQLKILKLNKNGRQQTTVLPTTTKQI